MRNHLIYADDIPQAAAKAAGASPSAPGGGYPGGGYGSPSGTKPAGTAPTGAPAASATGNTSGAPRLGGSTVSILLAGAGLFAGLLL